MEAGNRSHELSKRIKLRDAKSPAPEERARIVYDFLRQNAAFSEWDLICFSANLLAMESINFPWMEASVREINKLVYTAHYIAFDEPPTTATKPNDRSSDTRGEPKSLFDRADETSRSIRRLDTTPETGLHLQDNSSSEREGGSEEAISEGLSNDDRTTP